MERTTCSGRLPIILLEYMLSIWPLLRICNTAVRLARPSGALSAILPRKVKLSQDVLTAILMQFYPPGRVAGVSDL